MTWKLPGYVLEELVGYGGSGEVWRGHVERTGEKVALKRIPAGDLAQLQAARAEAALLSALDHPHLVRLHELVPTSDQVVLVLDLADGGSLADLIARRHLTPGEVAYALAPIGTALAYVHDEGVTHGDVTPANVLFTRSGKPLLADVGVARIIGDDRPVRSTPPYVDPAVASGSLPGPQSDVFMLAATAFHALTGNPLWSGQSASEVLATAAAADLSGVADRLAGVPQPLIEVLVQALVAEPHIRPSAAEFALDLRHSVAPMPVDLDAGRISGWPPALEAIPHEATSGADPARPAFERPSFTAAVVNRDQFTHAVRAALRPAVAGTESRRPRTWLSARTLGVVSAFLLVTCALIAGFTWWSSRGDVGRRALHALASPANPPTRTASVPATRIASVPATRIASVPATRTASVPAAELSPSQRAMAELRRLDAIREQAFAANKPDLLKAIYASESLRTQDVALLARLVPPGCGLAGVRTTYTDVSATEHQGKLTISATARLASSRLTCDGSVRHTAPGSQPTAMTVELRRVSGAYRIASQVLS